MHASPATARGRQIERELGSELGLARRAHGLSQSFVAQAVGMQQTRISRLERGAVPHASLAEVNAVAVAVGLRLVVRCYPAGNPLRDAAQVALLQQLHARLDRSLRWRNEVPVPVAGDLRAADAVITGSGFTIVVEAWTRLTDLQAQARTAQLKRREFGEARLLILVADTAHNRDLLRQAAGIIQEDFPMSTRAMLAALGSARDPGGDGIVLMRIGGRSGSSPGRAGTTNNARARS